MKPSLYKKSHSMTNLQKPKRQSNNKMIDTPSDVAFNVTERLVKFVERGMSYDNLRKHGNIIDKCDDVGRMSIDQGSLMMYIPNYNDMFNKRKLKIYPLQRLEQIVTDPSKYNRTKEVIKEQNKIKKLLATQKLKESDLRAVVGSKYRFQKSSTGVHSLKYDSDGKSQQDSTDELDNIFDLELYFDMKQSGKKERSKTARDEILEGSQANIDQRHAKQESIELKKERIDKLMLKEYLDSIEANKHKMIKRIVKYATDKHKNPPL